MTVTPLHTPSRLLIFLAAALVVAGCSCDDGAAPEQSTGGWTEPVDPGLAQNLAVYDGMKRPDINVLLISLDSVRRDYMSCYGHVPKLAPKEKTSPNIDRLGEEGVVFEDFYSNTSWTLPSHMAMITGKLTMVHGVELDPFALDPSNATLATILQRLGYRTAGFFTGPYCHERFGYARGMDKYEDAYTGVLKEKNQERQARQDEVDNALAVGDTDTANRSAAAAHALDRTIDSLSHRDINSQVVCEKTLAWIDKAEAEDRPWFVFAHYFDPHYDYIPPEKFEKQFDPDYTGEITGHRFFHNQKIGMRTNNPRLTVRTQVCSDRDLDHILALYEGEIAMTDHEIGKMLDVLREKGILDNTLVIVTSDHGEEFFEHGGIGHRSTLLEEQLQVPLVMRLPGVLEGGKRVKGLGSHPDLFPTVMEILKLPLPGKMTGRSLMPLVTGADDGSDRFVVGRLLQKHPLSVIQGPKVARHTIKEVFYKDTLKLYRWRRWFWPQPDCPEPRRSRCMKNAERDRAKDHLLRWVDLAKTPGEQDSDYRTDFDDPRAAAALKQWQDLYKKIQGQPNPVGPSSGGRAFWYVWKQPKVYKNLVKEDVQKWTVPPPGM